MRFAAEAHKLLRALSAAQRACPCTGQEPSYMLIEHQE